MVSVASSRRGAGCPGHAVINFRNAETEAPRCRARLTI
jgi:hypothetical protein